VGDGTDPGECQITSFSATVLAGHQVSLTGTVTDGNPASVRITFSGAATGSTMANSTGAFSFTTGNASLGTVSAVGVDGQNQTSNTATASIAKPVPSMTLNLAYGSRRSVTLSGTVSDLDAASLTVTFTGVVNSSVATDGSGAFSLTTDASALGWVNATTTDLWGQTSSTVSVNVYSRPPQIRGFNATGGLGNIWTFSGWVDDESPADLIVRLGGIPSLNNVTVTVQPDATFSYVATLQSGEHGWASAATTDWWGLNSNTVLVMV
jgi:hypothetical protein